jgi:hypothetical protein
MGRFPLVFDAPRGYHRPIVRASHPLTALLLTLVFLTGCSKDVERVVANERLRRGQEIIGETNRASHPADRDTYVGVGVRNTGSTLLVGEEGGFVAEAFLRVGTWNLPAPDLPQLVIDSVYFSIPNDPVFLRGISSMVIELDSLATPGVPLASVTYSLGTLQFNFDPSFLGTLREWAADTSRTPTLTLRAPLGGGVAGFLAGAGAFHVVYNVGGVTATKLKASSRATDDSYVHSPLTPAPTGTETALQMGGRYETVLALRADVPSIPPGFSLNEAAWVLHLDGVEDALEDNAFKPGATYLDVDVFRIGSPWTESATDTLGIGAGPAVPALRLHKMEPATDSTLVIPVPLAWMRGWAADSTTNHGILVAFTRWRERRETLGTDNKTIIEFIPVGANISSAIRVRSRETADPPQFRVSWTSPPPGRL